VRFLPKAQARFRLRTAFVVSLAVALIATFLSQYSVGPSGLHARNYVIGAASTAVLIDTPKSEVVDLSATAYDFGSLQTRADLIGNLLVSDPVKSDIARRAGIRPSQLEADSPITANVPQTFIEPGSGAAATDILASANHYKLQVQADPQVPLLHFYAQAPSADAAIRLVNATVSGLEAYLGSLSKQEKLHPNTAVRIVQLGTAHGGVVNSGAPKEIAFLVFITIFAVAICVSVGLSRLRVGWILAGQQVTPAR
jgi:hypothetical protein